MKFIFAAEFPGMLRVEEELREHSICKTIPLAVPLGAMETCP